jgi:hypothetical protein
LLPLHTLHTAFEKFFPVRLPHAVFLSRCLRPSPTLRARADLC